MDGLEFPNPYLLIRIKLYLLIRIKLCLKNTITRTAA